MKNLASAANIAIAPSPRVRVYISHEDPSSLVRLTAILQAAGYEVEQARSMETLPELAQRCPFELVLLGIKKRNAAAATEACRRARKLSPASGIVLISIGDLDHASGDRIADGLEAGADDYITAPVESREFLARIRAVLRRMHLSGSPRQIVRLGDLEMDIERRHVRQNGSPLHLTRTEFDLLAMMMQKPGTAFTHVQLLRSVWGPDYGSELEYLRAYIRLLRRKIDVDSVRPSYIRTVPGVGYCFQNPFDL